MLIEELTHTVPLPEGVSASYDGATFAVEGPRGKLERDFSHPQLGIRPGDDAVVVSGKKLHKRQKALLGTWRAHLSNMVNGVAFGFRCERRNECARAALVVRFGGDVAALAFQFGHGIPPASGQRLKRPSARSNDRRSASVARLGTDGWSME